jgi:hypothetical protein
MSVVKLTIIAATGGTGRQLLSGPTAAAMTPIPAGNNR